MGGVKEASHLGCTQAHRHPVAVCCTLACNRWKCGKLVPFLVSKPDGLVPPCRRPSKGHCSPSYGHSGNVGEPGAAPGRDLSYPPAFSWTEEAWGQIKRPALGIKPSPAVACRPGSPPLADPG